MRNKILIVLIAVFIIGTTSCKKMYEWNQPEDVEVGNDAIYPLCGEWYVKYHKDTYTSSYKKLYTYATSNQATDKMWINDGGFNAITTKASCSVGGLTFQGTDLVSTVLVEGATEPGTCTITEGKLFIDGGKSTSGVVVDSIYFKIEYDNDGDVYECSGIRRTGFLEDEH